MPIDPKLIDVEFEFDGSQGNYDDEQNWYSAGASEFPAKYLIDRSEWSDRIREMEKHKAFAEHFSDRFTHQGKSHECVCHAAQQLFMAAYNRQLGGTKHSVYFSPLSLYTRITDGTRWGGSNVQRSLRVLMSEGILPEHDGPAGKNSQYKRFRHTLHQTSGRDMPHWPTNGWVKPNRLPDGWEETAKHFRVIEAFTIPERKAHASALLHGWAVCNGRNGHSIPHMALKKDGRKYLSKYKDSYNLYRYDSEKLWGGGYCIRAVTLPDDPNRPTEMKD